MWRTSLPAHVPVCKGYRLPTVSKWMRTIKACPVAQQGRCNTLGCLEMSKSWLTYCRYPWNGHQHTQTHTHLVMTVIYFHWYKVWSVQWMFTACSLFWVCFTQQQLWCLKKRVSTRLFVSLHVCVWVQTCVCVWACVSREARNWLFLALTSHIRTQVSQALQTASSFLSCILYLLYPCLSPCISLYLAPSLVRFLDSFLLWLRHVKR